VKNNQDNQIQGVTLCNPCIFRKGIRTVHWGLGQNPRSWEIFQNFYVKSNLQSVRLLLTVSYRKMGEQDVLVAPLKILLGEHPPSPAVAAPMPTKHCTSGGSTLEQGLQLQLHPEFLALRPQFDTTHQK